MSDKLRVGVLFGGRSGEHEVSLSSVQAVLNAAYSVIGTPYQYGGTSPSTGFDCSGFTMWSWSHAGVSLPHSSAAQYAALPHVAREDLQPGDLLFFYSPISHVAIYVGGSSMIHSPHTGSSVQVVSVYWVYIAIAGLAGLLLVMVDQVIGVI